MSTHNASGGLRGTYAFEEIGDDLSRPPMAAMRALLSAGVVVSPRGWAALPIDAKRALVAAGVAAQVDVARVNEMMRPAPVAELRLVPRLKPLSLDEVPPQLLNALGQARRLGVEDWRVLHPLDRHVLATLALNTRLLWRAVQEILPEISPESVADPWKSLLARCEIQMRTDAFTELSQPNFLDGRGFVLARVAGVRAARRAYETFDLRNDLAAGPIELDWSETEQPGVVLWQAHVSSWDGAFYPAAALVAATTAAAALCDMIREIDPQAGIIDARISEETWYVGRDPYRDQATAVYAKRPKLAPVLGQTLRIVDAGGHGGAGDPAVAMKQAIAQHKAQQQQQQHQQPSAGHAPSHDGRGGAGQHPAPRQAQPHPGERRPQPPASSRKPARQASSTVVLVVILATLLILLAVALAILVIMLRR